MVIAVSLYCTFVSTSRESFYTLFTVLYFYETVFLQWYSIYKGKSNEKETRMKWKRYLLMMAGLLVICGFIVSCGHVHRPLHRVRGKHITSIVFLRMDNEATRLGLTQTQQDRYEELKKRVEEEIENDIRGLSNRPDEVLKMLETEDPDLEVIADDLKYQIKTMEDPRGKYLDYLVEFYNILDERQKRLFMDDLKKELGRHDRLHRKRPWG
jgi:hypothetical protein